MKRIFAAGIILLLASNALAQQAPNLVTFSKAFTIAEIGPGSTSTVRFTINNNETSPVSGLTFADALPTVPDNLLVASPALASTTCTEGSVVATEGSGSITFSAGKLGAGGTCTVSVNVTAATPGVYTNPSVDLTYDELSGAAPSSLAVDLTVDGELPGFGKSFAPSTVPLGSRSTLTFTIDNTSNPSNVSNLDFTDNFPAGMLIADPSNAFTDCGTSVIPAELTATAGTNTVVLDSDGTITFPAMAAGSTCIVSVDIVANTAGLQTNISGDLLADFVASGFAVSTLDVTVTPIALQKTFTDDPASAGGFATLEFKINNYDRNLSATDIAFTDNLATLNPNLAGLTFDSVVSNDCGGAVAGTGTSNISFSGGNLAPESFCSIQVTLQIPPGQVTGSYVNTTSAVTATVGGASLTGNQASDTLYISNAPALTKEFLEVGTLAPDPVVNPGDNVVLRFTVTNVSNTSNATEVTFIDELTDGSSGFPADPTSGFLPFPVSVTLPPIPDPPCGAGSSLALIGVDTDRQGLQLSGGVLDPGASCTFEATIEIPEDMPGGTYLNTTEAPSATVDGVTAIGEAASDSLTINAAPRLTKEFTDDPVTPGNTVTLEFTLSHPAEASADATDIAFTDDLAPVLADLVANALPLAQACDPDGPGDIAGTGTLSGSVGDTLLTFKDGILAPGESCTFSVSLTVPAAAPYGNYTNTTSEVSANVAGLVAASAPASDTLQVASLVFSKEFVDDPVIAGGVSLLRFTIENIHASLDADITFFTDDLGASLTGLAATGGASVDTCGGSLSGTTFLYYGGGSILAGTSCTIEVEVLVPVATPDDSYSNVTSNLSADQGGSVIINPATDTLVVNSTLLQLSKTFSPDSVAPGDAVTLDFVLLNLDDANAASDIGFTDDLGAALAGLTANSLVLDDCGGSLSGLGTDLLTYSGGALAANTSCVVRVSLDVPPDAAEGTYTNTTSSISGTVLSLAVTGDPATGDLQVFQPLVFSKSFAGPATAGGTAILTFSINNPRVNAVTGLSFSDDLNAFFPGMVASSLPAAPCGVQSVLSGSSFVTFKGGELAANGGACNFDIEVLVPVLASPGTYPNTTSGLFASGLQVADPATAELVIEPPPSFAKSFTPGVIDAGGISTLTFTIDNSASALPATNLDFTDNFPAGLAIASPASTSNTCSGTLTATDGSSLIGFTGGSVAAGAVCNISVDVTSIINGQYVNTTGDLTSSSGNSGTASDTLTVNPLADLSVTKTDGVVSAVPGLSVTYTIIASNNGPSTDPAASLSDVFPVDLTCTYTSLASGGATGNTVAGAGDLAETLSMPSGSSVTYTAVCSIDLAASGTLSNTATISASVADPDSDNNSATDDDTVLGALADLSISKTDGVTSANPGETITYTIVASNSGPSEDPAATVSDAFPADLDCTYTSVAAGGASGNSAAGSGDISEVLSMPSGSSVTYTAACVIDGSFSGVLSNTASIVASVPDPDTNNNTATDNDTAVDAIADLLITKSDGVTSAVPGESITYTIVASNNGPSDDPSVSVTDVFPSDLSCTYTSVTSGGASGNTAAGSGNLAEALSMPSGSAVTYTVVCAIDAAASGTLTNTATVAGVVPDPDMGNNSATDNDTVLSPEADLSISKTDGVTSAVPGESITYTIVASNNGPSEEPSASVADTFPADLTCSYTSVATGGASGNTAAGSGSLAEALFMPSGSSVTYTAVCSIDAAASGTLSNTATIAASVTDPDMGNNSATDDDTVLGASADVSISMTTSAITANPGGSITYVITASNGGPSDDPLVTVTDVFPAEMTCTYSSVIAGGATGNTAAGSGNIADSLSMPAGSLVTYTAICSISASASGVLSNTAMIAASVTDPSNGNDSATRDVTIAVVPMAEPIPTLSTWFLLLLLVLLAGVGAGHLPISRIERNRIK